MHLPVASLASVPSLEPSRYPVGLNPSPFDLEHSFEEAVPWRQLLPTLVPTGGILRGAEAALQAMAIHLTEEAINNAPPAVRWSAQALSIMATACSSAAMAALWSPIENGIYIQDRASAIKRSTCAFTLSGAGSALMLYASQHGGRSPFALMTGVLVRHWARENLTKRVQRTFSELHINGELDTEDFSPQEKNYLPHASDWLRWAMTEQARLSPRLDAEGKKLKAAFLAKYPLHTILTFAETPSEINSINPGPFYYPDDGNYGAPATRVPEGRCDEGTDIYGTSLLNYSLYANLRQGVASYWKDAFPEDNPIPEIQTWPRRLGEPTDILESHQLDSPEHIRGLRVARSLTLDLIILAFHRLKRAPMKYAAFDHHQYLAGWILLGVPSMAGVWGGMVKPYLEKIGADALQLKIAYAAFQDFFPELTNIFSKLCWPSAGRQLSRLLGGRSGSPPILSFSHVSVYPSKHSVSDQVLANHPNAPNWSLRAAGIFKMFAAGIGVPMLKIVETWGRHAQLLAVLAIGSKLASDHDMEMANPANATDPLSAANDSPRLEQAFSQARLTVHPVIKTLFGYRLPTRGINSPVNIYAPSVVRIAAIQIGTATTAFCSLLAKACGAHVSIISQASSANAGVAGAIIGGISTMVEDSFTYPGCDIAPKRVTAEWQSADALAAAASGDFSLMGHQPDDLRHERDESTFTA